MWKYYLQMKFKESCRRVIKKELTMERSVLDLSENVSPLAQSMPNSAQISPAYASSTS